MSAAAPTSSTAGTTTRTSTLRSCSTSPISANYLGQKYGGWYAGRREVRQARTASWISLPLGAAGAKIVYRKSWVKEAGLRRLAEGHRRVPEALPGAEGQGHTRRASRSAMRSATPTAGATGWCGRFGGKMVDENDNVVINSPETIAALEYAKRALQDLHPRDALLARRRQQQGVPRRADRPDRRTASRSTTRRRTRERPEHQGDGRRHRPRQSAARPGQARHRAAPAPFRR